MSVITTGINIVATGVNNSIRQVQRFGKAVSTTQRQVQNFANGYNQQTKKIMKSHIGLTEALNQNWGKLYADAMSPKNLANQGKHLKALERAYERTFRNIGRKYESMVMGSVALSMSGIGIMNTGKGMLGFSKSALDQARDFELVMKQIQFYGRRTNKEMEGIQKSVMKIGYDLPVTISEVGNAVLSAQKIGYDSVKQATKMAEEASKIKFMSLGKLDGEESLKYLNHFRKLTGYAVKDVGKLTDKLTMTADVSAASIDSLWKTIQSSRTAYDSLGGDENTFLTLTGTMADRLTPRNAGMALSSFAGGVQMAEKAGRENRGTRGKYYNQLKTAIGGGLDDFHGDILQYIEKVAVKSKELWGTGTERKGNLQSIFGKSAVDLFYAVDSAMKKTGKSMVEMREEIKNSGGHAEKLMETIMNSSYGTEEKLKAVREQFQILFGATIRPVFNDILTGIEKIIGSVNKFMSAHPKLTKVLGYGLGLTGLLLTATGAIMLFAGGILAIYASMMNLYVQLARNVSVLKMLSNGYSTAGAMIKGQFLGPLRLLGVQMLKMAGISFFLYLAWKNDFLKIRTKFREWQSDIQKGLKRSEFMWGLYAKNSVDELNAAFARNANRKGGFDVWVASTWTKARMLWDGIKDIWNDGTISVEKYDMLKNAGLLPYIEEVYEWKTRISDFWDGFIGGLNEGIRLVKDILAPLKPIWDWVSSKILEIFQQFGYFKNVNKGVGSQWEQWGQKIGYIVGSVLAIRVGLWGWLKAIKILTSPFRIIYNMTKKIAGIFDKFKNFGGMMKKAFSFAGRMMFPKTIRNWVGYGKHKTQAKMMGTGASSPLPHVRQNIDPATGKPLYDAKGNPIVTHTKPTKRWLARNQRKNNGAVRQGVNGSNPTRIRRTPWGRMSDWMFGETYIPDQRRDSRGRTYHQVKNANGGVTRTNAQGMVKGKPVRTGGLVGAVRNSRRLARMRGMATLTNMINFADSGMDYASSVGTKGHRRRSVVAGVKGFWNRAGRQGIASGGGSLAGQLRGRGAEAEALGRRGGAVAKGAKGGGFVANLFKGAGKSVAKVGPTIGKGLLKGFGTVLKKGIPLIFKTALRAFSFVGWALLIWDAVSLIWSNWDSIKKYAGLAWEWIKGKGLAMWNWLKTNGISLLGQAWTSIKAKGLEIWTSIKTWAVNKFTEIKNDAIAKYEEMKNSAKEKLSNMFQPIKDAWNSAKEYVMNNPITQTVKTVKETVANSKWNPLNWGKGNSHRTGLWNVPRDNYPAVLHNGEMVLTQRESQILRGLVGSDTNSVAQTLLDGDKPARKTGNMKPRVSVQAPIGGGSGGGGGETSITFQPGAIQISMANASQAEIQKGAKKMFEEFKRLVELENMKNYKPARPRRA